MDLLHPVLARLVFTLVVLHIDLSQLDGYRIYFLLVKGGLKFAPKKPPKKPAKVIPKTYVIRSIFFNTRTIFYSRFT